MKRRNEYLDKLGLSKNDYCGNFVKEKKIRRFLQRRRYGFDYRDVFNMDIAFAEWLYSHMKMHLEHNVHDLSFHSVVCNGKIYTIGEAIDLIVENTGEYLKMADAEESALSFEEKDVCDKKLKFAGGLFLEAMGCCWL